MPDAVSPAVSVLPQITRSNCITLLVQEAYGYRAREAVVADLMPFSVAYLCAHLLERLYCFPPFGGYQNI